MFAVSKVGNDQMGLNKEDEPIKLVKHSKSVDPRIYIQNITINKTKEQPKEAKNKPDPAFMPRASNNENNLISNNNRNPQEN